MEKHCGKEFPLLFKYTNDLYEHRHSEQTEKALGNYTAKCPGAVNTAAPISIPTAFLGQGRRGHPISGQFSGANLPPQAMCTPQAVRGHTAHHMETHLLHGLSLSKLIWKRWVLIQELLMYVCTESGVSSQVLLI